MKGTIEHLLDEERVMMITQLIGLGESQRQIYDRLKEEPNFVDSKIQWAYEMHEKELELLIQYEGENNS